MPVRDTDIFCDGFLKESDEVFTIDLTSKMVQNEEGGTAGAHQDEEVAHAVVGIHPFLMCNICAAIESIGLREKSRMGC